MPNRSINLRVIKLEYNIPTIHIDSPNEGIRNKRISKDSLQINSDVLQKYMTKKRRQPIPEAKISRIHPPSITSLMEELLRELYGKRLYSESPCPLQDALESETSTSVTSYYTLGDEDLKQFENPDLERMIKNLERRCQQVGALLGRKLCLRDLLKRRRKRLNSAITVFLQKIQYEQGDDGDMRFSTSPRGGASGWAEWLKAMKLVARLPTGVPPEFRKKLWLTLAEQHLKVKGVDWNKAEKICFSEWTNPDDTELGVQIVKDLHRTGCSLFCGSEGRENQAVLKRVLLAYARWNKGVGYCQGFNMLAALILEVMDRSESDSLKVMIYLIEAVLPEGYFANNLRGLSVDMAVFRDLLKLRLPRLSAHLDRLQKGAAEGSVYEPPLTNVFTMQWFLTLFCNCLPHDTVLRVWDLAFLEGDAVLLTTALAIWENLQDRILKVESADEFYSVMGELARETLEAPPSKGEQLIASAAKFGPIPELPKLRDKHRYNITPWAHSVQTAAKKGLRLFYSEDEVDSSDEGDKLAITTAYGFQSGVASRGRSALVAAGVFGHPDREKLALDISSLKQQYERLRERQRQAHIILAAACARQTHVNTGGPGPMSMNHLLLGKSAIVSNRGRRLGPPQGAVPPSRSTKTSKNSTKSLHKVSPETITWTDESQKKKISRRDSIKWKDIKQTSVQSDEGVTDLEEIGQQISDSEVNDIIESSMRTRRRSESSSYSECSESSTSTSLCDEPNRMSDFDSEPASASDNVPVFSDDNFESNVSRDGTENEEIKSDVESSAYKGDKEFGEYIQEFEDLLDRTNSMDIDRGLICVLPDNVAPDISYVNSSAVQSDDNEVFSKDIQINDDENYALITDDDEKCTANSNLLMCDLKLNQNIDVIDPNSSYDKIKCDEEVDEKFKNIETMDNDNNSNAFEDNQKSEDTIVPDTPVTAEVDKKDTDKFSESSQLVYIEKSPISDKKCDFIKEQSKTIKEKDIEIDNKHQTISDKEPPKKFIENDKLEDEFIPKPKFEDYMDSIRDEQLRSYLNEFKRAELYKKSKMLQLNTEKSEKFQETVDDSLLNDDQEVASICDGTRNIDKEDTATIRTISSIEYRSTSGDRSVSSSLSSVSPILRSTPGLLEEKTSFTCYKSPCREADLPVEFDEDEKPIILKIDKYFEHSPEFFGARKSSHILVSSDEEDDRYTNKRKNLTHKSKYVSPGKTDTHRLLLHDLKNAKSLDDAITESFVSMPKIKPKYDDYNTESTHTDIFTKNSPITLQSPLSTFGKSFLTLKSPDTFRHKRISSLDSPLSVKYLTKAETEEPMFEDDSPNASSKYTEHNRTNVLEKTKSEELPRNQTKSFSVLDDEIDAIRTGRRNSERALKIIQENSNILHSILVNQVNKCHTRETLPEESTEEINDVVETNSSFLKNKNIRILSSPRSTSFDDCLLKSNASKHWTSDYDKEYVSYRENNRSITSPTISKAIVSPTTPKSVNKDINFDHRVLEKRIIAPRPKSFESHVFLDRGDINHDFKKSLKERETIMAKGVEGNKTDRFGWENKGFEAKQRFSSIYKDEPSAKPEEGLTGENAKTTYSYDYKYSHSNDPKVLSPPKSMHRIDEESIRTSKYKLDPESSSAKEKNSSLTDVSETVLEPIESKSRDLHESPLVESNLTVSEHESSLVESNLTVSEHNISPPNKHAYKSSDISSYANSSYKNFKLSDLRPPNVTENFSRVTESSPIDNSYNKPDILKFETSHSSDLCIISSSMSFSFDPSVEDHTSTKPGTFNSSDTLCQLTSLDQVSTPISPKLPVFNTNKDLSGISHGDLALELDRFKKTSEENSFKHDTFSDTYSACTASLRTPSSPISSKDKNGIVKSPDKTFSPFPTRTSTRQPKEIGLRLGLYKDTIKSPSK